MSENPKFVVFCGPMFSGKSSRLLAALDRYRYQHKRIVVFKPLMDDRYSVGEVVTHSGLKTPAVCVKTGSDILGYLVDLIEEPHIVAVDEAFMIPGVAEALTWLYRHGFTVLVSTLDMSAAGKPFKEVEHMMGWATQIEKCAAVCTVCGRDAYYTHKKQTGGDEIEIGGTELYEPRCHADHVHIICKEDVSQ